MGGRFGKYGDAKRSVSVSHRALRGPEFLRRFHDTGGIGCRIAPQYDSSYGAGRAGTGNQLKLASSYRRTYCLRQAFMFLVRITISQTTYATKYLEEKPSLTN